MLLHRRTLRDPALVSPNPLGSGPDNIEVDARGDLWIAAHPKLQGFVAHAKDVSGKTRAPAQVLRLKSSGDTFEMEEVFLDPVFDPQFLRCELP